MRAECYLASVGTGGEQRPLHMMTAGQWLRPQSPSASPGPGTASSERGAESAEDAAAMAADAGHEPALVEGLSNGRPMSDQQQRQRQSQPRDRMGTGGVGAPAPDSGEMPTGDGDEEEPDASLLGAFLSDSASSHGLAYWLTASTVGARASFGSHVSIPQNSYYSTLNTVFTLKSLISH